MTRLLETKTFIFLYMLYLQTKIKKRIYKLIGSAAQSTSKQCEHQWQRLGEQKNWTIASFDRMNFLLCELYPKIQCKLHMPTLSCSCENR